MEKENRFHMYIYQTPKIKQAMDRVCFSRQRFAVDEKTMKLLELSFSAPNLGWFGVSCQTVVKKFLCVLAHPARARGHTNGHVCTSTREPTSGAAQVYERTEASEDVRRLMRSVWAQ